MKRMSSPGWSPSNTERLRGMNAIRTGNMVAYCSKCQKDSARGRKGPARCKACRHSSMRLREIVEWLKEHKGVTP